MPHEDPVNWQPIRAMPLIARMIDDALDDTREHLGTLAEARLRPHVLDDATIDRVERVHAEQMEFVGIYAQQISRWRTETPSADQARELDRMEAQNGQLRAVTADVLFWPERRRTGSPRARHGASSGRWRGISAPKRRSRTRPGPSRPRHGPRHGRCPSGRLPRPCGPCRTRSPMSAAAGARCRSAPWRRGRQPESLPGSP